MSYKNSRKPIQKRRLARLVKEYEQKGYSFKVDPTPADLPPALADFPVDLIAINGTKSIAIEVRSKETLTLNGSEDLRRISESMKALPGWELELVVTNSRKRA